MSPKRDSKEEGKGEEKHQAEKPNAIFRQTGPISRTGGVYIPPFKLAQMQKDMNDKNGEAFQRMSWEALRKSLNGLINKVRSLFFFGGLTLLFLKDFFLFYGILLLPSLPSFPFISFPSPF